jgi:acyl-CoA synthetase (AMP-forming)/AMP-acid ligase II
MSVSTAQLTPLRFLERSAGGGWFHSGDLGVIHPDGYVQLPDRAKDVVVSGGENISTGKVRKYELRGREWAGREARIRGQAAGFNG